VGDGPREKQKPDHTGHTEWVQGWETFRVFQTENLENLINVSLKSLGLMIRLKESNNKREKNSLRATAFVL
jgi:hypothetical protein